MVNYLMEFLKIQIPNLSTEKKCELLIGLSQFQAYPIFDDILGEMTDAIDKDELSQFGWEFRKNFLAKKIKVNRRKVEFTGKNLFRYMQKATLPIIIAKKPHVISDVDKTPEILNNFELNVPEEHNPVPEWLYDGVILSSANTKGIHGRV